MFFFFSKINKWSHRTSAKAFITCTRFVYTSVSIAITSLLYKDRLRSHRTCTKPFITCTWFVYTCVSCKKKSHVFVFADKYINTPNWGLVIEASITSPRFDWLVYTCISFAYFTCFWFNRYIYEQMYKSKASITCTLCRDCAGIAQHITTYLRSDQRPLSPAIKGLYHLRCCNVRCCNVKCMNKYTNQRPLSPAIKGLYHLRDRGGLYHRVIEAFDRRW